MPNDNIDVNIELENANVDIIAGGNTGSSGDIIYSQDVLLSDIVNESISGNSENQHELNVEVKNIISSKVDKVEGKELSTNDYTDEEKQKLENVEAGAQVNLITSVNSQVGDVNIQIPNNADFTLNGLSEKSYNNLTDKPIIATATSELVNDSGFITQTDIPTNISSFNNDIGYLTEHQDISGKADKSDTYSKNETNTLLSNKQDVLTAGANITIENNIISSTGGSGEITVTSVNGQTGDVVIPIPNKVSDLTNDSNFIDNSVDNLVNYTKTSDLDKTSVGLSNVDNTSDLDKPISNATNSALVSGLSSKVDKESGKVLSSNDYTTIEKNKLSGIEAGAQVNSVTSVNGQTGIVVVNIPNVSSKLEANNIIAGDNITVSTNGNNVTISSTGGGETSGANQDLDNLTNFGETRLQGTQYTINSCKLDSSGKPDLLHISGSRLSLNTSIENPLILTNKNQVKQFISTNSANASSLTDGVYVPFISDSGVIELANKNSYKIQPNAETTLTNGSIRLDNSVLPLKLLKVADGAEVEYNATPLTGAEITVASGVITEFKQPYLNDNSCPINKSSISALGMPSERYVNLVLPERRQTLVAPATGYYWLQKIAGAASSWIAVTNANMGYIMYGNSYAVAANNTLNCLCPARKGDTIYINYSTTIGATNQFRFFYAEGSK